MYEKWTPQNCEKLMCDFLSMQNNKKKPISPTQSKYLPKTGAHYCQESIPCYILWNLIAAANTYINYNRINVYCVL